MLTSNATCSHTNMLMDASGESMVEPFSTYLHIISSFGVIELQLTNGGTSSTIVNNLLSSFVINYE